jgi:hypothetical protein
MIKIKKKVKDPSTGEIIEVEGSPAEVEAFERKLTKKNQTEVAQRKKGLLYG